MKEWQLIEEIPRGTNLAVVRMWSNLVLNATGFEPFSKTAVASQNHDCLLLCDKREFDSAAGKILETLLSDPSYGEKLNEKVFECGKIVRQASKNVFDSDEKTLSNAELAVLFDELMQAYQNAHSAGLYAYVVDYDELFSDYLREYLKPKCVENGLEVNEVFTVLTTPTRATPFKLEEKSLLELALLAKQDEKTL
ncbi:MAG: hypothetical protein V1834_01005, partial [Candidatus Micrarchaeota archaeon]